MRTAFISIGSNIGDRLKNCRRAIERLADGEKIRLVRTSAFYETEPWGEIEQDWFINVVVEIETTLDAAALFKAIENVEKEFGRDRTVKGGPRAIDLDIIFFDQEVIREKNQTVPHPLLHKRRFVLAPLYEIAPDFIHPVLKRSVKEMLKKVKDDKKVVRVHP